LQDRQRRRTGLKHLFGPALHDDWILNMSFASVEIAEASRAATIGGFRSRFSVGGVAVEVASTDPELAELGPQLSPFAQPGHGKADIDVQVEWADRLDSCVDPELFHSGCVWSVREFGKGYLFNFATERFGIRPYKRLLVDREFRQARVLLNRECLGADATASALEYPLDELLVTHYLSLGRGVELHACGMVCENGDSFLFAGHSGAGKSTTARLWMQYAVARVLSDDRIIVRRNRTRSGQFVMHGTPWHGEAALASPECAVVRRVFLLQHGESNHIERLSRSVAAGELLARSFPQMYLRRFVDPTLALIEDMLQVLPCYRFHFVPDTSAVERILEFRD